MTILVIEHHDTPSLGVVGETMAERRVDTHVVWGQQGDPIPESPNGYKGLVLLGGAMSAMDDSNYPYLVPLLRLIRQFADDDIPVLGICHGAQMIARAFDAEVKLDGPFEFGFHEIMPTDATADDPVMGHMLPVQGLFEWHTDHYTLPEGAVHLARGKDYAYQGFRLGRATYATQFHFEADKPLVDSWIGSYTDADDWAPGYEDWLPKQFDQHMDASKEFCAKMTRQWLDLGN
jgi:GMP synthase (glutamine-hydrolysing)